MRHVFEHYYSNIRKLDTQAKVWASFDDLLQQYGIENMNYSFSPSSLNGACVKFTNTASDWDAHYRQNHYHEHDELVRYCSNNEATSLDWEDPILNAYKTSQSKKISNEARNFGIYGGYFVPLPALGDIGLGFFNVLKTKASAQQTLARNLSPQLLDTVANLLQLSMAECYSSPSGKESVFDQKNPLTPRERDCLTQAALGRSTKEIADLSKCSDRTVHFHIQNCISKTRAISRTHAARIAIDNGWISP